MYQRNLEHLVRQVQQMNDQAAFKELFNLLFPSLVQFAYSLVGNTFIAEEIVNDVFIKFWLRRKESLSINNVKVYLYIGVKNASLNQIRSDRNYQKHHQKLEYFYGAIEFNPTPEQIYLGKEVKKLLELSMNELPPKCKLIFQMTKEEGLSVQEVSEILNLSYKTVHTQLRIAITKIGKTLASQVNYSV